MFSCGPLVGISSDGKPTRVVVEVPDDQSVDSQYAVIIKFTGNTISLLGLKLYFDKKTNAIPFEAIQALNIVLRQGLVGSRIAIGASLFRPSNPSETTPNCMSGSATDRIAIGSGKQLAYGVYQSLRPCIGGAQLVVDRSCTAFWANLTICEFVKQLFPYKECESMMRFKWNDFERKRIERELKGLHIHVSHLMFKKKYKIHGISRESAQEIFFDWTKRGRRGEKLFEAQRISVAQYFLKEYQIALEWPHLPCVIVRNGQRSTYYPIEVCRLVSDQHVSRKLSPQQTAEVIRICASTQPKERFDIIEKAAKDIALNPKCLNFLNEFSVKVKTQPIGLSARVLNAPVLLDGSANYQHFQRDNRVGIVEPRDGKWRIGQFFRPVPIHKWIVVNLCALESEEMTSFIDNLKKFGQQLGMNIAEPVCRVRMTYQRSLLKVSPDKQIIEN